MIHELSGLGDGTTTALTATQITGQAAGAAVSTAVGTGAMAASTAAVAVPIIGAVVLGVTIYLSIIAKRNAQKTAATHIVDDIEPQLRANVDGYIHGPRTPESQAQAIANFNQAWSLVLANCGQPALGSAGQRCIDERKEGGTAPWCPTPDHLGCDWFSLYKKPILDNPPLTQAQPAGTLPSPQEFFSQLTGTGSNHRTALLIAGAALAVIALTN